jgi:hypothetical protein
MILMSSKRKKSSVRGSIDLAASTTAESGQAANQQDPEVERITVKGDAVEVYEAESGTDIQGQQIYNSSFTAESNTNTQSTPQPLRSYGDRRESQTRTYKQKDEDRVNSPGQRDEDGIRAAVEVALRKLNDADAKTKEDHDKVEADDERRKSDIVKDFAKDLEGKIPTGSIAAEIVHQLVDAEKARHGKSKVSKRLIYKCLDSKYRRQWQKKHKDEDQDQNPDPNQQQSAPVHFDKKEVIPIITSGGNKTVVESIGSAGACEYKPEVSRPTPISTPVEQDLKNIEPELATESQIDPEQVLQEPSHNVRILLSWDSLSEQMARAHSPGIEWVWLSGVLDEKSRIVSDLKLEGGEVLK